MPKAADKNKRSTKCASDINRCIKKNTLTAGSHSEGRKRKSKKLLCEEGIPGEKKAEPILKGDFSLPDSAELFDGTVSDGPNEAEQSELADTGVSKKQKFWTDPVNRKILRAVNKKLADAQKNVTGMKDGKLRANQLSVYGGKAMEKDAKDGAENFIRNSLLQSAEKHMRLLKLERLMRAKRRNKRRA